MEQSPLYYTVLEYAHSIIGVREEKREKMRENKILLTRWPRSTCTVSLRCGVTRANCGKTIAASNQSPATI